MLRALLLNGLLALVGLPALAAAADGSFTVVAVGDIVTCDGLKPVLASAYAETAALVKPTDALVLTLGDSTYPVGALKEFNNCFKPTWGAFKDRIRPAPGNHEYMTPGAAGYYDYFADLAGPDRRGYYSFDYGGWHFISLNSNIDVSPQSPQYQWLLQDLARSKQTLCTIAYWHHPLFSSGLHGNNPQMAPFYAAVQKAGVDIILNGHDHIYERFGPQTAEAVANPTGGVREFVIGTGGAPTYPFRLIKPNSEVRNNNSHGVVRFNLAPGRYSWRYEAIAGSSFSDTGSGQCHL
jgi:hypothetical protein